MTVIAEGLSIGDRLNHISDCFVWIVNNPSKEHLKWINEKPITEIDKYIHNKLNWFGSYPP